MLVRTHFKPSRGRPPGFSAKGAWCSNSYQALLRTATRDMAVSFTLSLSVVPVLIAPRKAFLRGFDVSSDRFIVSGIIERSRDLPTIGYRRTV
jgi:hypothetical protein